MASTVTRSYSNIRNERVELLVHYALSSINQKEWFGERRFRIGPSGFCTEFDHIIKDHMRNLIFLGQTTCYKERGVDGGEPNKTYEMRETLMEYLLVHVNLLFGESEINIDNTRFFHIIFGDPSYSYSYFHKIRSKCYDLNIVIYPSQGIEELYNSLEQILPEDILYDQSYALTKIKSIYISKKIPIINETILNIVTKFNEYLEIGYPRSITAQIQEKAICDLAKERNPTAIKTVKNLQPGMGIKKLYLKAAKGDINSYGDGIRRVVEYIFSARPFLPEAKKALEKGKVGWREYIDSLLVYSNIDVDTPIFNVLYNLWNIENAMKRELIRRIIIKLPGIVTGRGIAYPQDIPVRGVTEHNLYKKIFNNNKTKELIDYLLNIYISADIISTRMLIQNIKNYGRPIIKKGFDYDVKNGTVIKPVRHYVVQALKKEGYKIRKQKEALGSTIKGYHGELFDVNIRSFTSIEIICTEKGLPIAMLKAKYFRPQEFDRRVKEEGFTSFTSSFNVVKEKDEIILRRKLEKLPRIMFIDTEPNWTPDPEPVKQLIRMGWDVFFKISDLIKYLESIKQKA